MEWLDVGRFRRAAVNTACSREKSSVSELTSWYALKPYPHFDLPLGEKSAVAYVSNPANVVRHPFYPLISYTLISSRFRKDPQTKRVARDPDTGKPVKEDKSRRIAYPSHKDGYIFSYYKSLLGPLYESWLADEELGEAVTAFRKTGQNNVTLSKKAFDFIKASPGCQILATDVEGFFDNIDHQVLKATWTKFLGEPSLPADHYAVYKAITRYTFVERHKVYNLFGLRLSGRWGRGNVPARICTAQQFRDKVISRKLVQPSPGKDQCVGIPQGTSLSPLLSNMYMADLDLAMHRWATSLGGRYWRYCDDVLVVLPSGESADIVPLLDQQLALLKLTRHKDKTYVLLQEELPAHPLQYLGFVFNGSKTSVRSSSIHRYHRKVKSAVQATRFRQKRESLGKDQDAPFRKQALYNMYSDLPLRGQRAKAWQKGRRYRRNFTHYMAGSAKIMGSDDIKRQRRRALKRLRDRIRRQY